MGAAHSLSGRHKAIEPGAVAEALPAPQHFPHGLASDGPLVLHNDAGMTFTFGINNAGQFVGVLLEQHGEGVGLLPRRAGRACCSN